MKEKPDHYGWAKKADETLKENDRVIDPIREKTGIKKVIYSKKK